MNDVEESVTRFLLGTCLPQTAHPRNYDVVAAVRRAEITLPHPKRPYRKLNTLLTRSAAEFYVQPMLQHLGDIDIMCHFSGTLATPHGHPPPTQLPDAFHDCVVVYEITNSLVPGYVYLQERYLLTKCTGSDRYDVTEYEENERKKIILTGPSDGPYHKHHGPAYEVLPRLLIDVSQDVVPCARCLSWPPQAADWQSRRRDHGWPDSATVDRVVSNGCDVVHVAHHRCKQDALMHRLSFSRAEIELLNCWTENQQIIYHVLRVFMKKAELTGSANNSEAGRPTLSNYHIKTLILWECEEKSKSWWTDNFNVVKICVDLLHSLADRMTGAQYAHYFVSNCILADESFQLDEIVSRLRSIDREWLSSWFVNNYLRTSVRICPESVSLLFDDVSDSEKLLNAVLAAIDWRIKRYRRGVDKWLEANSSLYYIASSMSGISDYDPRCLNIFINELIKIHLRFGFYTTAVAFLHLARRIVHLSGDIDETWTEAISLIANEYLVLLGLRYYEDMSFRHNADMARRNCQQIETSLNDCNKCELGELLQQSAVGLLTTFLEIQELDFGSVATIATTMFEALYAYKRGDYEQCLQLSAQKVPLLLNAEHMTYFPTFPEFIQLMDDDIVCLSALTLLINAKCRLEGVYDSSITQLTLSLYLMTQCQLKLVHPVSSLLKTFDNIQVAKRKHDVRWTLSQLTLKLSERKLVTYLRNNTVEGSIDRQLCSFVIQRR